jgi:hypothetical protein
MVEQMISFIGNLQDNWQAKWEYMRSSDQCLTLEGELNSLPTSTASGVAQYHMWHLLVKVLLILLKGELPELEVRFGIRAHDNKLLPVMSVIRGLMTYRPSDRMTASDALEVLKHTCRLCQPIISDDHPRTWSRWQARRRRWAGCRRWTRCR